MQVNTTPLLYTGSNMLVVKNWTETVEEIIVLMSSFLTRAFLQLACRFLTVLGFPHLEKKIKCDVGRA